MRKAFVLLVASLIVVLTMSLMFTSVVSAGYTCPDHGPSGADPVTCESQADCDSLSFRDCYYEGGTWHEVSCDYSCYVDGYCSKVSQGGGPCTGTSLWMCSADHRSRWRYVYDGTCSGGYCGKSIESENCASGETCINGECVSCGEHGDCALHKAFVYTTICQFPDACTIHINSLKWIGPGDDLNYGPGSALANKIVNSEPQGMGTFKELINFGVKSEIIYNVYPDINCVPIGGSQPIYIFDDSGKIIGEDVFDIVKDPELWFAFHRFRIYPDDINQQVTLTRVRENDYKVTGTINICLNDEFVYTGQEWTDQWAYRCQQAGCIHNFWTRVDMNFIISDLEFPMTSSNMHCDGDPDEIKCCPDGCVNIKTDLDNCGECGNVCTGTTPGCCSGSCKDLDSDENHCGSCNNSCGANAHCSDGACECDDGYGNCDGDWSNGCEVNLNTDPNNCGSCGNECGANAHCSDGACECDDGYGNCDGDWSNGCEVNLNTDPNNCGSCGNVCGANAHCLDGACGCDEGYGNCDGDWSNGCEVDLNTDPNNCGACSNACDPGETCENGECCGEWEDGCCKVLEGCLSGHLYVPGCKDSGGSFYKGQECCPDGDCHDLNTDPNNCGACGNVCPPELPICEEGECVPEASTLVLFATGLLSLAGYIGLKRRKTK